MFLLKKCYDGRCPKSQQLPLGVLAPNSANQSRLLLRSSFVRNNKGTVVIPDGTSVKTGVFYAIPNQALSAPASIGQIYFDRPFRTTPVISLVLNDYGNNAVWIIHVRNVNQFSFELILKNADKPIGAAFAVYWSAVGQVD